MGKGRKRNKQHHQPARKPPAAAPAAPASPAAAPSDGKALPAPLKALDADYSALLQMRNVRWLIVLAVVVGALLLGYWLSDVFVPLLAALGVAYVLNPLVARLQKRGVSRPRAVLWIFIGFIVLSAAFGTWFAASVVRDVRSMGNQLGTLIEDVRANQDEWVDSYNDTVPASMKVDPGRVTLDAVLDVARERLAPRGSEVEAPEQTEARAAMASARADLLAGFQRLDRDNSLALGLSEIPAAELKAMDADGDAAVSTQEWFDRFGASAPKGDARTVAPEARETAEGLWQIASKGVVSLFSFLLFLTLVPIYAWYFMVGYDSVVGKVREYLPGAHRPRIERLLGETDAMLKAFFRGRLVIVAVISGLSTILFWICGVKYAFLLGLMSGLGILIPYFSVLAGYLPALLLMLVDPSQGTGWIVGMSVGFFGIQSLEQYVLTPKLLGDAVELHPVTLLVGVFVMGSLFGVFGLLLAVPLTAIAKTLGREFLLPYFRSLAQERPAET